MEKIIKTQSQLDKIKPDFKGTIYLEGGTEDKPLFLKVRYEQAKVITRGLCQLIMRENSVVKHMWGNSVVQDMRENSVVQRMRENSVVQYMRGNSVVQRMRENSVVQDLRGNSVVQRMRENSVVQDMRGNSVVQDMRENSVVKHMWGNSVVQDMRGNSVVQDMRENSVVQDMWENSVVQDMWENSVVQYMWGNSVVQHMLENSVVQRMRENSVVQDLRGNSVVQRMRENSVVQHMWENSVVQDMWENSVVQYMRGNSVVQRMRENSVVQDLYGEAIVSAYGNNKITCHGYNIVRTTEENEKNLTLIMNKESNLIVIPKFKPTFKDFQKRYPFKVKGTKAILFKAVHKKDGKYFSENDKNFEYAIGEIKKHECEPKEAGSCAKGLHVAHKDWAISFGNGWKDMALLECEVPIKSIVVSEDCDGKVRCSELKVIREVPKEEYAV